MKVFKKLSTAARSLGDKESFYLNSYCPYDENQTLCGSWCALFYLEKGRKTLEENTSSHVILGCKAGEKWLCVEEIVEE